MDLELFKAAHQKSLAIGMDKVSAAIGNVDAYCGDIDDKTIVEWVVECHRTGDSPTFNDINTALRVGHETPLPAYSWASVMLGIECYCRLRGRTNGSFDPLFVNAQLESAVLYTCVGFSEAAGEIFPEDEQIPTFKV